MRMVARIRTIGSKIIAMRWEKAVRVGTWIDCMNVFVAVSIVMGLVAMEY